MVKRVPVKIKKLKQNAVIPTKGSDLSAGYDIYATIDTPCQILPHQTVPIGIGLAVEIPEEYQIELYARSGLSTKKGIRPANCVGTIDADYRGEIIMPAHNDSEYIYTILPGDRIGQLKIRERYDWDMEEVSELNSTARQAGGFGSTGK